MIENEYYIWGAGTYGRRIIEFMQNDLTFKAVIDNDPKKQGTLFHGVPVISFDEAKSNLPEIKIVIALNVPTVIREFLLAEGFVEYQDFFTLHDFIPQFYWRKNKSLIIKSVDFAVTTKCNMKCRACQALIPFAAHSGHITTENIMRDLDLLFSQIDSAMTLNICCGESLLNKALPEICASIYKKYSNRYHSLLVQSNGTVLPTDDVMRIFSESRATIVTSSYPENAKSIDKLIEKCKEFNIQWYSNSSGDRAYWYDLGDPNIVNEIDSNKLRTRYTRCWKPGMGLYNGWLYICASQLWSHLVAEVGMRENGDAFDLRQIKTEESREELYKIISRCPPKAGYISHCVRCESVMNPYV